MVEAFAQSPSPARPPESGQALGGAERAGQPSGIHLSRIGLLIGHVNGGHKPTRLRDTSANTGSISSREGTAL